jgi:hypothetical protein
LSAANIRGSSFSMSIPMFFSFGTDFFVFISECKECGLLRNYDIQAEWLGCL